MNSARVGDVFSDGLETLHNTGDEPLMIEAVTPNGGDKSLEYLGARIGLPGRPDDFNQRMEGFPPTAVPAHLQVPAVGATLAPGETYMLILGYRVSQDVHDVRDSVTIRYLVGSAEFSREIPAWLVACPSSKSEDDCLSSISDGW